MNYIIHYTRVHNIHTHTFGQSLFGLIYFSKGAIGYVRVYHVIASFSYHEYSIINLKTTVYDTVVLQILKHVYINNKHYHTLP